MENREQDIPQRQQRTMNLKHLFPLFIAFMAFSCQKMMETPVAMQGSISSEIDAYVNELMAVDEIPGIALAVMKDSTLLHKKYYGYANLEHHVRVSDSSVFRLYSLTKLMTAVAVFRLIQEDKIKLDDRVTTHLEALPEHWGQIKIEHLLAHSSGLPEYKDLDKSLSDSEILGQLKMTPLRFPSGERFEYNQTGYWLLQKIMEKVSRKAFEEVVIGHQFPNAANEAFFASNSLVAYPNRNAKYNYNHEVKRYEHSTFAAGNRSLAGNGLNTTLDQLITWNKRFDDGTFLNAETKTMFLSPFPYANDDRRFLQGSIDEYSINGYKMYGFSGGAVVDFKKFETGLTIIILSNGFKYRPRIATMMHYLAGIADGRLKNPDRIAQEQLRIDIMKSVDNESVKRAYRRAKEEYPLVSFEGTLNSVGYDFLQGKDLRRAIEIFQMNAEKHPNAFNTYDSLGEAFMIYGDTALAIANYKKSLALNPNNGNAAQIIERITKNNP